jgi:hypothetical protein
MSQLVGTPPPERQVRVKFDSAFQSDALAHHITRRDVERVLRWPRWVDELTAGAHTPPAEIVTAWVARPPVADPRDPSLLLVVTRDRRNDRRVHDAWRLYFSDIDLGRARSGFDVLEAFLERYGFAVQLGAESRRLFLPSRVPMGPAGNAAVRIDGAEPRAGVRPLEVFRLVPERVEIEVAIAFAVNEAALRTDLERHAWAADGRILRTFS